MFNLEKLFGIIADFLFPQKSIVKEIEGMDAEKFRKEAFLADINPNLTSQNIYPLFRYRNPIVKEAIWQIKYKGNKKITNTIAELLYEEIIGELENETLFENFGNPLLIPIPISKKRLKKRGFNQMELLGNALQAIDKEKSFKYSPDILCKIKETLPQTIIKNRQLRLLNLKGCFEVKNSNLIKNRNVILIDDVLTTGSTVLETKNTLKQAGAKRVIVFTIAH